MKNMKKFITKIKNLLNLFICNIGFKPTKRLFEK